MRDLLNEAINRPAGKLAEILVRRLAKGSDGTEIDHGQRIRLERLLSAGGKAGALARVRLACDVAIFFERAPTWTRDHILPLFDWSSPEAWDAWESRKYANHVGSPELFRLLKKPFLEMFGRKEIPADGLRTFADWIGLVLVTNQLRTTARYPLTPAEGRSALRQAGPEVLSHVAHRLAIELGARKPEEKVEFWRTVIGPVFNGVWPLDIELQTNKSTFQLVQILMWSGDAFPEAADAIIPFIRPDDPGRHPTVYSIARAADELLATSPTKVLELVGVVVGDAPAPDHDLSEILERIKTLDPKLSGTPRFQRLLRFTRS